VVRTTLDDAAVEMKSLATASEAVRQERMRELLEGAMRAANHAVFERGQRDRSNHGMGTTLEVVAIVKGQAFIAHAGDSRTYLVRDGSAQQVTFDHTVAQVMRRAGTISPEEAEVSPMRSVLSNAVGISVHLTVDHAVVELQPGDRLLMCTDGLYEYFAPDELSAALSDRPAAAALDALIEGARSRGGADNITGIIVEHVVEHVVDAAAPLELDEDAPTTPISVPVDTPPRPLDGVADGAVSALIEQGLRESSQP
jgi:serine/threonine protein phosphatase PrpC